MQCCKKVLLRLFVPTTLSPFGSVTLKLRARSFEVTRSPQEFAMRKLLKLFHAFLVAAGFRSEPEVVAQEDGFSLDFIEDEDLK